MSVEARRSDITRLRPGELADATLITASALLDILTEEELMRLIGVSAGDLHRDGADPQQLGLFQQSAENKEKLSHTIDEIKEKFGTDALRRGSEL